MKHALLLLLLAAAGIASAQTTYSWTDPATGSTIYSDQPPPPGVMKATKKAGKETGDEPQQSYAVRTAAEKFPVTLYTSADCVEACQNGRNLLNGRGVPFQEKLVQADTPDMEELKKLTGGEGFVPTVVVGRQSQKGYEASAWNNLLDLAGYPKTAPFGSKPSGAFAK
ncbi:MAG: hypothetical protein QG592_1503 [Pseudomonadota bacterium]|nr:hypothetical protein [Pseudomonadota bacterium]MDQ5960420.1 hypothetical protein [Pseudomonadota bacterium]